MKTTTLAAAALMTAALLPSASAHHEPGHGDHRGHSGHSAHGAQAGRAAPRAAVDTPATREFKAAHHRMMGAMNQPYTGDPDVDFRVQMIPHHQGAIDMARVALKRAKDPWTRQLAEAVIIEQQREIAEMRAWLAKRGVAAPESGDPQHIVRADSVRQHGEEAGTRDEARGQSWAPGAGIR